MHRGLITALALAAALVCPSDVSARTIYVNAKRPNNKGNGLKVKTAKKTIQAAINIAKKGDTILVYPGTYGQIWTKNKKITIKSVKGQKKTKLISYADDGILAELSKEVKKHNGRYTDRVGNATMLSGFLLDGQNYGRSAFIGVSGGTVKSCTIQNIKVEIYGGAAENAFLSGCTISGCRISSTGGTSLVSGSTLQRCKVRGNEKPENSGSQHGEFFANCKLYNCLVSGNKNGAWCAMFSNSTLINSTVAKNKFSDGSTAEKSKFYNCILWENYSVTSYWVEPPGHPGVVTGIYNVDTGKSAKNTYTNTDTSNKDPKLTSAYKLKKGSYAINKGKLTKAQKKLVGTKDLAGNKRIKGKAIDCGCYEY